MADQYKTLTDEDISFIGEQKVFFIASSSVAEVNLSPKGYDCLRVIDEKTLLYLDYPGSGNRTARDIENGGKVTVMFTAFTGEARITRCFCTGELIEKDDQRFGELFARFEGVEEVLIRRLILFSVETVEKSCGISVPVMEYKSERGGLKKWAKGMSDKGKLEIYIKENATPPEL